MQVVPNTQILAAGSQCGCSVSEILRMEREVLSKLDWNLRHVHHIDFLHTVSFSFYSLLFIYFVCIPYVKTLSTTEWLFCMCVCVRERERKSLFVNFSFFLFQLHALLLSMYPQYLCLGNMTPSRQLSTLTSKLFRLLCSHKFMVFRPCVLVLSLLSLELETYVPQSWLQLTMILQRLTEVSLGSLIFNFYFLILFFDY